MPEATTSPAGRRVTGHRTYTETVARGLYDRNVGGLTGKHDNVRTYWEDELTRRTLRPFVKERVEAAAAQKRRIRILDMGCGAGQGLELLTRISEKGLSLDDPPSYILTADKVGLYLGLDLSSAMVEQGRENYATSGQLRFEQADLNQGLGPAASHAPFDLYFSSYGALSHLQREPLRRLLAEIGRHSRSGAYVVMDLVGRRSLEWPGAWKAKHESEKVRSYSMSYLYEESQRRSGEVERFPLRFWTGPEVRELCEELSRETGLRYRVAALNDRSLFVGRHVDTREYGCALPPLRGLVNRLYENNLRTRIDRLRVEHRSIADVPELDRFFSTLALCWNQILDFSIERLAGARIDLVALPGWREFPPELQLALMTMDRIVDSVAWIDIGEPRANIIEPQLAYVLCRLEFALQRGLGCGHGLLAVVHIDTPQ